MMICFRKIFLAFVVVHFFSVSLANGTEPPPLGRLVDGLKKAKNLTSIPPVRVRLYSAIENYEAVLEAGDYSPKAIKRAKQMAKAESKNPTKIEYAFFDDCVMKTEIRNGRIVVTAKNGKYAFGVSKEKNAESYVLGYLEKTGGSQSERIKAEEHDARELLYSSWDIEGFPLLDWISRENFKILDTKEIIRNGRKAIRLDFEHIVDDIRRDNLSLGEAYVICDPAFRWAIIEYSAVYRNKEGEGVSRNTTTIEYRGLKGNLPIPTKSRTVTELLKVSNKENVITTSKREILEGTVTKEEFYLSHYGLPEPDFDEPFLSTWMKYLLAGLVCLGIAYWVKRRRAVA